MQILVGSIKQINYNSSLQESKGYDMPDAIFVFHGLFPDVMQADRKQIAQVLFDIDLQDHLYSHYLADIEQIAADEFEVRCQLPINCPGFAQAALDFYQYAIGPQKNTISHSGPKVLASQLIMLFAHNGQLT
jgi:hypothetical protein